MPLKVLQIGLKSYRETLELQYKIFQEVKMGLYSGALIFCRHYPVITLGRSSKRSNILFGEDVLASRGIKVENVERGGDVTYHGPGQLVVYPILNLSYFKKDIHWFLRQLEEVVMMALADFGVAGSRRPGFTGVWIKDRKICSIGIAIKHWITFHGLSLNVKASDLSNFSFIKPCGLDVEMTSMETELQREVDLSLVQEKVAEELERIFSSSFLPEPVCA